MLKFINFNKEIPLGVFSFIFYWISQQIGVFDIRDSSQHLLSVLIGVCFAVVLKHKVAFLKIGNKNKEFLAAFLTLIVWATLGVMVEHFFKDNIFNLFVGFLASSYFVSLFLKKIVLN